MTDLTPEILMAYADGQLDSAQRREVEILLIGNPEAQDMVARFRRSTEILDAGLENVLQQPVPKRLLDTVQRSPAEVYTMRPRSHWHARSTWPGLAAAASILMVVGVTTGVLMFQGENDAVTTVSVDPLQQALEDNHSGSPWVADTVTQITPMATFLAADGRACREFERVGDTRTLGIACRDSQGQWVAEIELQQGLLSDVAEDGSYLPASGGTDPISNVLDRLGAGPALTVEEESRLLESGWGP